MNWKKVFLLNDSSNDTGYSTEEKRKIEQRTFRLHLVSQIFMGLSFGITMLQDVILKKSLAASDFQVTILIFLTSSAFLFSIYGTELIHRSSNQARTIIRMALFSRFFLIIIPLFETPSFFIFCIAAMCYTDSLLKPSWNTVFKHNYTDSKRSMLYSYASSVFTIILLLVTTLMGYLLDINYEFYKIFYPLAGIFDILAYINLAKMIRMTEPSPYKYISKELNLSMMLIKDVLILPVRNLIKIFKENRPFFRFEMNFFLYGMAFMIASPAVPIFLVQTLNLDYAPISIAKGLVFYSATILFTPVMGKMHGSGNPTKFCGYLFLSLILYPLLMISIKYAGVEFHFIQTDILLYITFFYFGIAMSGVTMSWNLSSIYYAPHSQVANYQAVHITLTGVRGIFAPFIGYFILRLISIEATFLVSSFIFMLAGVMMMRESKRSNIADSKIRDKSA